MAHFSRTSYWLEHFSTEVAVPAEFPERADCIIIGGGITGASTALHLARKGVKCIIVERGCISAGATGRNGGVLAPGLSESVQSSVDKYGVEVTQRLQDYTTRCTAEIKDFVEEFKVECDLRFNGRVSLAATDEEAAALQQQYDLLRTTKCEEGAEWWDTITCFERTKGTKYICGLFRPSGANLYPAKLVKVIVEQAIEAGAQVLTDTTVVGLDRVGNECVVRTSKGNIMCSNVVHATNAWARELLPALGVEEIITPVRNQVVVTAPLPPLWKFSLSANSGYIYFNQFPDGRVIIGGMRNLTPSMEVNSTDETTANSDVSKALRCFLATNFDLTELGIKEEDIRIDHEWVGILGFSKDKNPLIGPLTSRPGEYIAAGFSGHGMPYGFLAGKHIAGMIADGNMEPDGFVAHVFTPSRFGL